MNNPKLIPAVSFQTARTGASAKPNEMGMRQMQERAYAKRGEQYPPMAVEANGVICVAHLLDARGH